MSLLYIFLASFVQAGFVHIGHDGGHAAIRNTPWLWEAFGFLTEICMGISNIMWMHRHVVGHHVYTNVSDVDPDIGEGPFYRGAVLQKWKPHFRWQVYYKLPLYCLGLFKIQYDDCASMITGSMEHIRINLPVPWFDRLYFWSGKFLFLFIRLALPGLAFGTPFSRAFVLFIFFELFMGYWFAFNTQVSHISQNLAYPTLPISKDWAALQVMSSQDYGHDSYMNFYLTGGLNFQTVHHLFPSVSMVYLPAIAPIVKQKCKKYKVPFNHLPSFTACLLQHIRWLGDMAVPPLHYKAH